MNDDMRSNKRHDHTELVLPTKDLPKMIFIQIGGNIAMHPDDWFHVHKENAFGKLPLLVTRETNSAASWATQMGDLSTLQML